MNLFRNIYIIPISKGEIDVNKKVIYACEVAIFLITGLQYRKEKRLKIKDEVIEMKINQKGRKLMLRKVLMNIKISFMINLFFNCLSINSIKLDEKKFQPKENSILYKIEDNQQFGNKHGLQKIVNVINSELYNSKLITFKEAKQDKKYIYMVIENNPPEPQWTKQLLLSASIMTFSIIPFHDIVINKVQYEERENEKVMNKFEYEFELGFCLSLFSLNCTFFHEEKFTFAPFFLERLDQEVYLKIGKEFIGKNKLSPQK